MFSNSPLQGGQRSSLAGIVAICLVLGACGSDDSAGEAFDSIRGGNENASRERVYKSWDELVAMSAEGKPGQDAVDAAVVGDVTGVTEGRSFVWDIDDDGETRTEVKFGDDKAMIWTYHLSIKVSSVVGTGGDTIKPGWTVTVGIAVDPDVNLDAVKNDFSAIEGALFFLQKSPVFDYADNLYAIVEDGALMAVPDNDGNLSFPLLDGADELQPPKGTTA